jgi:TrmH family RNA methyltransferase
MPFAALTKNKLKSFSRVLDKKFRQSENLFLIEGIHLIQEFLQSGFEAEWIVVGPQFVQEHAALSDMLMKKFSAITCQASHSDFRKLSDTENPEGIAAAVRNGKKIWHDENINKDLIVAVDRISDPGNLGTILRTADWFGVKKILLSESCVEVYNPKVVRAGMGSIFHVACYEHTVLREKLAHLKDQGYRIYGASSKHGHALADTAIEKKSVIVVGNESHGLSPEVQGLCDVGIKIAQVGHGESLNAAVACGILLHEFSKYIFKNDS